MKKRGIFYALVVLVSVALCNTYMGCSQTTKNVVDDGYNFSYIFNGKYLEGPVTVRIMIVNTVLQKNQDGYLLKVLDEVVVNPKDVIHAKFNIDEITAEIDMLDPTISPMFRCNFSTGWGGMQRKLNWAKGHSVKLTFNKKGLWDSNRNYNNDVTYRSN